MTLNCTDVRLGAMGRFLLALAGCYMAIACTTQGQESVLSNPSQSFQPVVVSAQAQAIHGRSYVFDGHNDLPWTLRRSLQFI